MNLDEIITKSDLLEFEERLIQRIIELISENKIPEYLRSAEVRKILKISPGSLQTLRTSGKLKYSKVGGILYYKYQDVMNLLSTDNS